MIRAAIWLKDAKDKKLLMGEYDVTEPVFKQSKEDWLKWLSDGQPKGGAYKCTQARTSLAVPPVQKELLLDFSNIASIG